MPDESSDGPGALPPTVDALTLLAEGFFPTHAPRPNGEPETGWGDMRCATQDEDTSSRSLASLGMRCSLTLFRRLPFPSPVSRNFTPSARIH